MFRRMVVMGLVVMGVTAWAAESSPPPSKPQGPSPSRSGHLPINGLKLYYEVYGELGKYWASGGGARTKSGLNGSVGVKIRW